MLRLLHLRSDIPRDTHGEVLLGRFLGIAADEDDRRTFDTVRLDRGDACCILVGAIHDDAEREMDRSSDDPFSLFPGAAVCSSSVSSSQGDDLLNLRQRNLRQKHEMLVLINSLLYILKYYQKFTIIDIILYMIK